MTEAEALAWAARKVRAALYPDGVSLQWRQLDVLADEIERGPVAPLPLHRTEAGYPNCSTCDGGGCPDCTDPA